MKYAILLNRDGGTLKSLDVSQLCQNIENELRDAGHTTSSHIVDGENLVDEIKNIINENDVDVIIAGGGDGTVSLVASMVWQKGKSIAVLPAGTMNLFARSIDMSLDIDLALAQIAKGENAKVDVVTANDTPFLHQFSLGLQPQVVKQRDGEAHRSRVGKILSGVSTFFDTIARPPVLDIVLEHDDGQIGAPVSLLCVTNNLYGRGHIPFADGLDKGRIGVYWAPPLSTADYLKLTSDLILGTWQNNPNLCEISTSQAKLKVENARHQTHATIDGELVKLERTVEFVMHHKALGVVKPKLG